MRRFSQRHSLVTLSDINITPLLDLAFVLLIIFVITTPALTQSLALNLPGGGRAENARPNPNDVRTVEVTRQGQYHLDRRPIALNQMEAILVGTFRSNPNLIVYIRADQEGPFKYVAAVLDLCQRHNITRISVRTDPYKTR